MVYVLLKSIIFSAATLDLCVNIFVGLNSGWRTSDSLHFVGLDPGTFATPYQHLIPETPVNAPMTVPRLPRFIARNSSAAQSAISPFIISVPGA